MAIPLYLRPSAHRDLLTSRKPIMIELPTTKEDERNREKLVKERMEREQFHFQMPYLRGFRDGWDLKRVTIQGELSVRFKKLSDEIEQLKQEKKALNDRLTLSQAYYDELKMRADRAVRRLKKKCGEKVTDDIA